MKKVGAKPQHFIRAGYVFVGINYRFVPKIKHPQNVQDVADALVWIHKNARKYGGDPDTIFVMGHSAGAHPAALVATDDRRLKKAGKDLTLIKGAIPLDVPAYDLPKIMPYFVRTKHKTFLGAFGTDPAVWRDASPVTHAEKGKGIPPFLIVHVEESDSIRKQSRLLARALENAGVPATVYAAKNRNHGSLTGRLGTQGDATTTAVMEFLERIRKGRAP